MRVLSLAIAAALALAGCTTPATAPTTGDDTPRLGEIDTSTSRVTQRQLARLKVPNADELVGKEEQQVKELFGDPTLARDEMNAKVWQYAHGACILFFFMYEDPATARYQVTHLDARAPRQGAAPLQDCVDHAYKSHYVAKASS